MVYLYMWLEIYMIYMYHIYIARYVHTHKCTKFYTPQTSEHKFHFLKMYSSFQQYLLATVSSPSAPPSPPATSPLPDPLLNFLSEKSRLLTLLFWATPSTAPNTHRMLPIGSSVENWPAQFIQWAQYSTRPLLHWVWTNTIFPVMTTGWMLSGFIVSYFTAPGLADGPGVVQIIEWHPVTPSWSGGSV